MRKSVPLWAVTIESCSEDEEDSDEYDSDSDRSSAFSELDSPDAEQLFMELSLRSSDATGSRAAAATRGAQDPAAQGAEAEGGTDEAATSAAAAATVTAHEEGLAAAAPAFKGQGPASLVDPSALRHNDIDADGGGGGGGGASPSADYFASASPLPCSAGDDIDADDGGGGGSIKKHTRSISVAAGDGRTRHQWLMSRYLDSSASSPFSPSPEAVSASSYLARGSSLRVDLPNVGPPASVPLSPCAGASPSAGALFASATYFASASPLPCSADRFRYAPSPSYYRDSPAPPSAAHPALIPQSKSANSRGGNPYAFLHASPFRYNDDCYYGSDDDDSGGGGGSGLAAGAKERSRSASSRAAVCRARISSCSDSSGGGNSSGGSGRSSERNNTESAVTADVRSAPGHEDDATCPSGQADVQDLQSSSCAHGNLPDTRNGSRSISSSSGNGRSGRSGGGGSSRRHSITDAIMAAVVGHSEGGSVGAETSAHSEQSSVLMAPCDANEAALIEDRIRHLASQRLQVAHTEKRPEAPHPTALHPLLASDIVLDPFKKVQWFGDWDNGRSWKETRSKSHRWSPEDTVAVTGLPGRIPMGKMVEYVWLLLVLAMGVTAGGAVLFSLLVWAKTPETVWLAVMGVLGGRGVLLAGYFLILRFLLQGAEQIQAACYAVLDLTTAAALAALLFLPSSLTSLTPSSSSSLTPLSTATACYLLARSLCELLPLFSSFHCKGREWWTSLLAVWPVALVGIGLLCNLPAAGAVTGSMVTSSGWWFVVTALALCSVEDGLPLWVACVVLRVRLIGGRGSLPQHARRCVKRAVAVGTVVHGAVRLLPVTLFFVGKYAL